MGREITKFGITGVLNTALDWSVYFALTRLTISFENAPVAAKALAFIFASLFSFYVNRYWTFGRSNSIESSEFIRFYTTVGSSLLINSYILYLVLPYVGSHDVIALVAATVVTAVWNFILLRTWVYKPIKSPHAQV